MAGTRPGVLVVIPARDEGTHLGACLHAVLRSIQMASTTRAAVVVVDDASRDDTRTVARQTLAGSGVPHLVTRIALRNVGAARRMGVRAALAEGLADGRRDWLLSTDADSIVPPGWVERVLRHADRGARAVAGIVRLSPRAGRIPGAEPTILDSWDRGYRAAIAPDGRHAHVHAANLALDLPLYLAAGEFAPVPTGEDHALWRAVSRLRVTPVADAGLCVTTSARLRGRAPQGFADALHGRQSA